MPVAAAKVPLTRSDARLAARSERCPLMAHPPGPSDAPGPGQPPGSDDYPARQTSPGRYPVTQTGSAGPATPAPHLPAEAGPAYSSAQAGPSSPPTEPDRADPAVPAAPPPGPGQVAQRGWAVPGYAGVKVLGSGGLRAPKGFSAEVGFCACAGAVHAAPTASIAKSRTIRPRAANCCTRFTSIIFSDEPRARGDSRIGQQIRGFNLGSGTLQGPKTLKPRSLIVIDHRKHRRKCACGCRNPK